MDVKEKFLNGVVEEEVYIAKDFRHMKRILMCANKGMNSGGGGG